MTDIAPVIWEEVIALAEQMFSKGCCSLTTDDSVLVVRHKNTTLFILQKLPQKDFISMHLRAGLLPNAAAWIASSFYVNFDFVLGENFEFDDDKKTIYGLEALRYASNNIKKLWDLEDIKMDGAKMEVEANMKRTPVPKGSSIH
jgi:hypothetical protein